MAIRKCSIWDTFQGYTNHLYKSLDGKQRINMINTRTQIFKKRRKRNTQWYYNVGSSCKKEQLAS